MQVIITDDELVEIIEKHLRDKLGVRTQEVDVLGAGVDLNDLPDIYVQVTTD